jgi:serine/threonine protein kinase/Tol biopolymer transport system component
MHLSPGFRLGPYEIVAPLGAGGMGEVYLARDPRLGREVAVKVLPERLAHDPEARERFEREARAVAALSHPNILALHDCGQQEGTAYAVMEALEGETLRQRLTEGPLPPRKAIEYAVQIAHGLAAAHDRGIVHRDLKPDNVFLTRDGRVKILDFGLAQQAVAVEGDPSSSPTQGRVTEPGLTVGTPGYMAPEQVRGVATDHRADIFAFGCILHEMLGGRRAFPGDHAAEAMAAILRADPVAFEGPQRPPAALLAVLGHCLEKVPGERYQSARDLAFHLQSAATAEAAAAVPPVRRRWPVAAAVVAAALGAASGLWLGRSPASGAAEVRALTHSGQDAEPSTSPDGRSVAFTSRRDGRSRIWIKQLATGEETALTDGIDRLARFSPDGGSLLFVRGENGGSALYLVGALGGAPRRVARDAVEGDFSPDGKQVAVLRQGQAAGHATLLVAGLDGSGERTLATSSDARFWSVRWSPDGRRVAALDGGQVLGNRGRIALVEVASGARQELPLAEAGVASALAWAGPDALLEAHNENILGAAGRVYLHDVKRGTSRLLFSTPSQVNGLDRLGADRIVIGSVAQRQNLREQPLAGGEGRWLTRGASLDRQPVYSPDGEWVVFSSDRSGNLDLWAVSTRTLGIRRLTHDDADDYDPAFAPGGGLLWTSRRSGHFEVWAGEADGASPRQLSHDGVDAENPTATRDGRSVVYASASPQHAGIWRIGADGGAPTRLTDDGGLIPEVSPDGRHVVYLVADPARRSLRVVDVASGQRTPFELALATAGVPEVTPGRPRWMPDGSLAFVGLDEQDRAGVFGVEFDPGREPSTTRRKLAGFEPGTPVESFGMAPDGSRITVSLRERQASLLLVSGLGPALR